MALPDQVHRQARMHAFSEGKTLLEWMTEAVREKLAREQPKEKKENTCPKR